MKISALFLIPIYIYRRFISPLLPRSCRFEPTCSCYGMDAIEKHGVFKGGVLAIWRILRCNPWITSEYIDPVPEVFEWRDGISYKLLSQIKNKSKKDNESK